MNKPHQPEEAFAPESTSQQQHEQGKPETYQTLPEDDRRDDLEHEEDDLDEIAKDDRRDWGDVDPAGGEAPTSPGSAV